MRLILYLHSMRDIYGRILYVVFYSRILYANINPNIKFKLR